MTRRRLAVVVGLIVVFASAAAILLVVRGAEDTDGSLWRQLRARATVSDRLVGFGDTIRARVEVSLDRRRVDPGAVRVRADFGAWRRVETNVERTQAGNSVQLRLTYVLRCAKQACVPERDVLGFQWEPARVEYVESGGGGRKVVRAPWPALRLHTRVVATDLATTAPWRLDVTSVPEPSWRADPTVVAAAFGAGALLFLGAGGVLAFVGWPRRPVEPEPEREPEPEPELRLTPLEQALELLEDAARANGAGAERRSLELVAEVLAERGESDELARRARTLAWSPTTPRPEDTKALAASVRATLEEELRQLEEQRLREEEERRRRLEEANAQSE